MYTVIDTPNSLVYQGGSLGFAAVTSHVEHVFSILFAMLMMSLGDFFLNLIRKMRLLSLTKIQN